RAGLERRALGLGRRAPAAADRDGRFGRGPDDGILRGARGAAPLAAGSGRRGLGPHLGPRVGAGARPEPGRAAPTTHRRFARVLPARRRPSDSRPSPLRPAQADGAAGAAGAGHGQGADVRAGAPGSQLASPRRSCPCALACPAPAWPLLVVLPLAFSLAPRPLERYVVLGFVVWLAARAPIGAALEAQSLFSPAPFFPPILGPLSGWAGGGRAG